MGEPMSGRQSRPVLFTLGVKMGTKIILRNCPKCGINMISQQEKICSDCWSDKHESYCRRLNEFLTRLFGHSNNNTVGDELIRLDIHTAACLITVLDTTDEQSMDAVDEILSVTEPTAKSLAKRKRKT